MCGITGIAAFNDKGRTFFSHIDKATRCLSSRGPDNEGFYRDSELVLGHRRLSIIDVSEAGNQPMSDNSGRYRIVFNGEFFNYADHRSYLESKGVQLRTSSDTEVLLNLFIMDGIACLEKVNGFFAFAIYDTVEKVLHLVRDRMGIKPLFYYFDQDKLIFGSELKSLMAAGIPKQPDRISILNYLQLNYIPGPATIFENVRKLSPGHYIRIDLAGYTGNLSETRYYSIPGKEGQNPYQGSYASAKTELHRLLEKSVQLRLISDVPLGAFLSGGIDSSVIVALAARHTRHLNTFSIGFADEPMYDETKYAKLVADRYDTEHTVFSLTTDDLFENLYSVLDYLDEPFADSSALAVNILSEHTRKHVTVALSGDGADELFGGYNKHRAEWILRNNPVMSTASRVLAPLMGSFAGSRGSVVANKVRQLHRFAEGARMNSSDRYWRWCGYAGEQEIDSLVDFTYVNSDYFRRKKEILAPLNNAADINDLLRMDLHLVLPGDMLVKVDMMSMAHSLEVRVPFLDFNVVNLTASLPSTFKIDKNQSKKILRETFAKDLPAELLNRPKHGFEVPLLKWFRTGLRSLIEEQLLSEPFIDRQGLFNYNTVSAMKRRLFSSNPGDITPRIWGLIVFQYWWRKYMD